MYSKGIFSRERERERDSGETREREDGELKMVYTE